MAKELFTLSEVKMNNKFIKIKAFGNINIIQEDEQCLFKYENKGKM